MTDEEYILRQTNRERKTIGRSAQYKRNGSKSRYVSLPSDHLTAKQKKGMNGEVMNYKTKGCTWKEFNYYPADVKNHILNVYAGYGASTQNVCDYLGVNKDAFRNYLYVHRNAISVKFANSNRNTDPRWLEFIGNTEEPAEAPEPEEVPVAPVKAAPVVMMPTSGSMTYEGNGNDICMALCNLFANGRYAVHVSFEVIA